jgi:rubrerythrin
MTAFDVDLPVEEPPAFDSSHNPMPLDWEDRIPRHRELWEKAEAQHYDPNVAIDWSLLDPADFSEEQRVALAYWFATNSTFENSGVPTFGIGMVQSYEQHLGDSTSRMLLTIARDEGNHDEMSRRIVETLLPGFPDRREATSDLERHAANNLGWIHYTNSKYWDGYKRAYETRSLAAVMSPFIVGEAAASLVYMATSRNASHPVFAEVLRRIGMDEARHFAFCNYLADATWGELRDDEKTALTKNLKAAYIYISVVFGEPREPFWNVPDSFGPVHRHLEDIARDAGLGIIEQEDRDDLWRKGMLRVKSVTDRFGIPFPAVPELGIDGTEVALTEDDLMVVSF